MPVMTREELAFNIKDKYPEVADLPAEQVVSAFLEAHPEFVNQVDAAEPEPQAPENFPFNYLADQDAAQKRYVSGVGQGIKNFGIGTAELVNHLFSDVKVGGEPLMSYDPAAYAAQRAETSADQSRQGKAGRFVGEMLPSLATMKAPQPSGFLPRVAMESGLGSLQSEIVAPGSAKTGAVLGAGGASIGGLFSGRSSAGRDMARHFSETSDDQLLKVLSARPEEMDKAREAVPYLRDLTSSWNPLGETTGKIVKRVKAVRDALKPKLEAAWANAEASGQRFDERPVLRSGNPDAPGLRELALKSEIPNSQVPQGTMLRITLQDIQNDPSILYHRGITPEQFKDLQWGAARGGVDFVEVPLESAVVQRASRLRHKAIEAEASDLERVVADTRAAEAATSGVPLSQVPPGLKPSSVRVMPQQLGRYNDVLPTPTTAAGKMAEKGKETALRREINRQFPAVGEVNEPFHQLTNIETLMERKANLQKSGTAADRYAAFRGVLGLIRMSPIRGFLDPAAISTIHSSAYHVIDSKVRGEIAAALRSNRIDDAARILARWGETALGDDGSGADEFRKLGVRVE